MKIDLLETSAIGSKSLKILKLNGCYYRIKEPTRVTPTSESLLDHIVHNDCLNSFEFGVIKTNITYQYATYFGLEITKSQFICFQQTRKSMTFFRNGYHKEKRLNYLRHCLKLKFRTGRR